MKTESRSPLTAVGSALRELGASDARVCLLDSDGDLAAPFAETFPERRFLAPGPIGSLVATASGLAATERTVFVVPDRGALARSWGEITRASEAGARIIVLDTASPAEPGSPASSRLGLALAIPGLAVLVPADATEAALAIQAAATHPSPSYISLPTGHHPLLFGGAHRVKIGSNHIVREGQDAVLAASGPTVGRAIEIAGALERDGLDVGVLAVWSLSPMGVPSLPPAPFFVVDEGGGGEVLHGLLAAQGIRGELVSVGPDDPTDRAAKDVATALGMQPETDQEEDEQA